MSKVKAPLYVFVIFLIVALAFAASHMEGLLTLRERPEPSDAIVILLGGARPERVKQAAFLLIQQKIAPRLVFGSGFQELKFSWTKLPYYRWSPGGQRYMAQFMALGVSRSHLIEIPTPAVYDSDTELREVIAYVRAKHWQKITLVTSASHSRRAKLIWHRLAPDIKARMVAAADPTLKQWWRTRRGFYTVLHELLGYLKEVYRRTVWTIFSSFDSGKAPN